MLKSNAFEDCKTPDLKIPIDVLLDNMTRDEQINLLFKVFDRLGASTETPEDPENSEDLPFTRSKKENLEELENDYSDEVRTCAGCNFQSERDLCRACEPFRREIAQKLNADMDFYHGEAQCDGDHIFNYDYLDSQLKQWNERKVHERLVTDSSDK
jgi:hypothetical protein